MHTPDSIFTTVVLLTAGVLGLGFAKFAHISPIVGFFILGAVIGPEIFGLIDSHSPTINFLGELGVCFLLFDIGLHLSLKELRQSWQGFIKSGTFQFAFVTFTLSIVGYLLGLSWTTSVIIGAIFSLSSTALILKILSDEREESSPVGKRATEILVFQDIIAILLLVILSGNLKEGISVVTIITPIFKMIAAAVSVIFIGRIALKPLFRMLIAIRNDEVITAFALLLVFLASWITESLGLSLALGAFLGGLALSESSYSYLVRGEISPFRSLLLSLFFLSVGINLDLRIMIDNSGVLLILLVIFTFCKVAANLFAFRLSGVERGVATLLAFLLAQGSEFAFVLLGLSHTGGLIDNHILSLGVALVGITLAFTPLLGGAGCYFSRSVCRVKNEEDATLDDTREVIIVQIDEFGRQLAGLLEVERIPYRAHDNDLERLAYAKSRGLNVYYSDLNRPRTLGRVSLGKALAVVSLMEDDHILPPLIQGLRHIDSSLPIIAATESPSRLEGLSLLGIEQIFIKNDGSLVAVFEALLRSLKLDEDRIDSAVTRALRQLEPESLFPNYGLKEGLEAPSYAA